MLTGVQSLASAGGQSSFCALLASGGVDCWGDNEDGELGNGSQTAQNVIGPQPVQVLGVGGRASCPASRVWWVATWPTAPSSPPATWSVGATVKTVSEGGSQTYNVDYPVEVLTGIDAPLIDGVSLTTDGGGDSGELLCDLDRRDGGLLGSRPTGRLG